MMLEDQATERHLNGSGSAEGMGMQGFRRTHWDSIGLLTEDLFEGPCFSFIIERCRAAMGVDIPNRLRGYLCFLKRELHGASRRVALRMRGSHMVRIIGESIAEDFPKNCGAAPQGVL